MALFSQRIWLRSVTTNKGKLSLALRHEKYLMTKPEVPVSLMPVYMCQHKIVQKKDAVENKKSNSFEFFNELNTTVGYNLEYLKSTATEKIDKKECASFNIDSQLDFLNSNMTLCSDLSKSPSKKSSEETPGQPSPEQVHNIRLKLEEALPKFFKDSTNYSIYHPKVVFENNIWKKRTVGLGRYAIQLSMVRILANLKYTAVKFEIVRMTSQPNEGTVKVRWRIAGLSNLETLKVFKYRPGKFKENFKEGAEWTDGLSTFYIDHHGLIVKHQLDNVVPDDEVTNVNPVIDEKVAPVGLMSKTEINKFVISLLSKKNSGLLC